MNKKYERYIEYIVNDMQPPYFKNMGDNYGLRSDEYEFVLSKLYKKPVTVGYEVVYDYNNNRIYFEDSKGFWIKREYDQNGNEIYYENSYGYCHKREFDQNGNIIYFDDSGGYWAKREFDQNGNEIYYENSNGEIRDYR